jgi:hypothetical protein
LGISFSADEAFCTQISGQAFFPNLQRKGIVGDCPPLFLESKLNGIVVNVLLPTKKSWIRYSLCVFRALKKLKL